MTTRTADERLGAIVKGLLHISGWSSPGAAEKSYLMRGEAVPVRAHTISRIITSTWGQAGKPDGEFDLMRLSVMLQAPPRTLELVYKGDIDGIRRLEFDGKESVRQFVIDAMTPASKATKRRAAGH